MKESTIKNVKGRVEFRSFYAVILLVLLALSECSLFVDAFQMASRTTTSVRQVQDSNNDNAFGSGGDIMRFRSFPQQRNTRSFYMSAQLTEQQQHSTSSQTRSAPPPSLILLQHNMKKTVRLFYGALLAFWKGASRVLRRSWWILPMFLALVPVYCAVVHQANAVTPSWWKLVKVDSILKSDSASLLVGAFLMSNLSYFFSGLYLLLVFPKKTTLMTNTNNNNNSVVKQTKKTTSTHHHHHSKSLASWILAAGTVSTIFHAVQALGPYEIAESFCYLDHAVAISAGGYFLKRCGNPSLRTWAIGGTGLTLLSLTGPGYAFLHSVWHFVSAAAAVAWAHDGREKKKGPQPQQMEGVIVPPSKPATA